MTPPTAHLSPAARNVCAALLLGGSLVVLASLQLPWVVDGLSPGTVPSESGWQLMVAGDVLLTALAVLTALMAVRLVLGRDTSVRAMRIATVSMLVLSVLAALGVVWVRIWVGFDWFVMDEGDLPAEVDGVGSWVALAGLAALLAGAAVLLAALRPEGPRTPPPHPHVAPASWARDA